MSFLRGQRVLVDTNVIIEAHRTGCWTTLAQHFHIVTVEKVIEETQTGAQNRSPETHIDEARLRASIGHVAVVTDVMRAEFHRQFPAAALDDGERDLLVHAGTHRPSDSWLLNSPDVAAIRHAHARGWLDRMVSLEAMNTHLRGRLQLGLQVNYTERWLSMKRTKFILG